MIAITIVRQSTKVSFAMFMQTAIINATAATFTASKTERIILEFLIFGINGFNTNTNINEGKKIPIVAAIAPVIPFSCHPIKVAVDKTGPGVI